MMTDTLTINVNYIPDSQNNERFNFNTINQKNFENRTDDVGKYMNIRKKAKKTCIKAVRLSWMFYT